MRNVILAAALAASTVTVQAEVTGSIGAVNDYRFRGISQSDRNIALQGDITYNHVSGMHVGAWASSIDFDDDSAGNIEADYTIGFGGTGFGTLTYDVGVVYYDYVNAEDNTLDFYELYGSLGATVAAIDIEGKISYSPDYFGETGKSIYAEANGGFNLPQNLAIVGHLGYQYIEDGDRFFTSSDVNYIDYSVGLEKYVNNLTFGAYYVGTDIKENKSCAGTSACDDTVVFQVKLDI